MSAEGKSDASADATATADTPSRSLRRFGVWIGGAIVIALAGWAVAGFANYGLHRLSPSPPPLEVQVANIIHQAALTGRRLSESTTADLQGSGQISHVFLFQSISRSNDPDLLQIYEVSSGRLRRVLAFEPVPASQQGQSLPFSLQLVGPHDVDGSGRDEIVLSLGMQQAYFTSQAPLLAEWDPLSNTYKVVPMLTPTEPSYAGDTRPSVKDVGLTGRPTPEEEFAASHLVPGVSLYTEPETIRNKATGATFRTYATDSFLVSKGDFNSNLVASYIVGASVHQTGSDVSGGPSVDDLNAWSISASGPPPLLYACADGSGKSLIKYRATKTLAQEWAFARRTLLC